jgi:hypothetical protein
METHMNIITDSKVVERLLTHRALAEALGVPIFKLRRAARTGVFPTYRIGNGRALFRMSEVLAAIETTRIGGAS